MGDNRNVSVGDSNKLTGLDNYYVWSLKMWVILRQENWWQITETRFQPKVFPVNVGGRQVIANQLESMKASALFAMILFVSDDIVDIVVHIDPAIAWNALKEAY